MRHKCVVGNWKMHTTTATAARLARAVVDGLGCEDRVRVVICPPFPYLALVGDVLTGSRVALGAQNLYPAAEGAFTGEVSPAMLLDLGCTYVILGHSERRHTLGESDAFINRKVRAALGAGLRVILCVGETLDQRNNNQTAATLAWQLNQGLAGVPADVVSHLSVAYEPVWAIGNPAHHATPQQAQDAHAGIRRHFGQIFDDNAARELVIQYGGSVEPENAAALMNRPGVDGALVGGASLHADPFLAVVRAGCAVTELTGAQS
jgi:triosephosphate isomerase